MTHNILRIDASARRTGSVTRDLSTRLLERFQAAGDVTLVERDLADGLPLITEDWIGANFTPEEDRTKAQKETLALSDKLVDELKAADTIIIGLPIYNFGIPAAMKAWIDLVARARVTFAYTETGPVGLLTDKRVILTVASGGTEVGSAIDYATTHLTFVLNFMGITDVQVVSADQQAVDLEAAIKRGNSGVDAVTLAA